MSVIGVNQRDPALTVVSLDYAARRGDRLQDEEGRDGAQASRTADMACDHVVLSPLRRLLPEWPAVLIASTVHIHFGSLIQISLRA